ncbi:phage virion morphogenesis protein [Moraxella sp. ATCC 23246]
MVENLSPAEIDKLKKRLAMKLRRSQSKRIGANQNPDGSSYAPRKPRTYRNGKPRKQVRSKMMKRIRLVANMWTEHTADGFYIEPKNRVAGIAAVHHFGLSARIGGGKTVSHAQFPSRKLLGFSQEDRQMIQEELMDYIEKL